MTICKKTWMGLCSISLPNESKILNFLSFLLLIWSSSLGGGCPFCRVWASGGYVCMAFSGLGLGVGLFCLCLCMVLWFAWGFLKTFHFSECNFFFFFFFFSPLLTGKLWLLCNKRISEAESWVILNSFSFGFSLLPVHLGVLEILQHYSCVFLQPCLP